MNKKLLILMAVILVTIPVLAGCTRQPFPPGGLKGNPIPHPVHIGFANCLSCHAGDMLRAADHADYTNKDCSRSGVCHPRPEGDGEDEPGEPTGSLPSTPHVFVYHKNGFTPSQKADCISCHGVGSGSDFPTAPQWNGTKFSQWYKGLHEIAPGSPQDHTNRTNMTYDGCTAPGCHAY